MGSIIKRDGFIERTARKPHGKYAIKAYNNPKAHYKSFFWILKKLDLGSEDTYVEIGCGGGVLLRMVLEKVSRGAAIDHSSEMVELSTKNNQVKVSQDELEIICGDAENLPWKKRSFTAAASANMFFFIDNPQAVIDEIYRVLKPGGRFAMTTMGKGLFGKLTFGWLYKLKTYSDKEMEKMFSCAGFNNIEIQTVFPFMQQCYGIK